jgi:hypothetical protein
MVYSSLFDEIMTNIPGALFPECSEFDRQPTEKARALDIIKRGVVFRTSQKESHASKLSTN